MRTGLVVFRVDPAVREVKIRPPLIRTYYLSFSGAFRLTPDPDTNRSVQLSLPADSQIVVAVQPFDGHHSHVHRCDFQNA